jgi:hypothetical protein
VLAGKQATDKMLVTSGVCHQWRVTGNLPRIRVYVAVWVHSFVTGGSLDIKVNDDIGHKMTTTG